MIGSEVMTINGKGIVFEIIKRVSIPLKAGKDYAFINSQGSEVAEMYDADGNLLNEPAYAVRTKAQSSWAFFIRSELEIL